MSLLEDIVSRAKLDYEDAENGVRCFQFTLPFALCILNTIEKRGKIYCQLFMINKDKFAESPVLEAEEFDQKLMQFFAATGLAT